MIIIRFVAVYLVLNFVSMFGGSSSDAQELSGPIITTPGKEIFVNHDYNPPMPTGREIITAGMDDREKDMHNPMDGMGMDPREHGNKTKFMIMWNLIDYLHLDDDTIAKLFPLLNEETQKREKLMDAHRKLAEQIIAGVDSESVSISELKSLVKKLDDINESLHRERMAFLEKAKKILDDRQYIKLVIFNDKLKKDLFNRFSERHLNAEMPGMKSLDGNKEDIPQKDDNKKLEELQKIVKRQRMEIELQQKQIESLSKAK
jgi:hypothetical protein